MPRLNMKLQGLFRRPTLNRRTVLLLFALAAIFSAALLVRAYPAKYGFYLNEFDPYYDYYATKFIVDNAENHGLGVIVSDDPNVNYFKWQDYRTWYPEGRDVAATSQVGLHFTGAISYLAAKHVFGLNMSLYDFLVLFPVFLGALTTIVMYLLVRRISGNTAAGLLAALIVAFSTPIIMRGNLGWYKSEPLAIFLVLCASYLYLTAYEIKRPSWRYLFSALGAGLLLGYANTAWGGSQYFSIVFGVLLLCTPFLGMDLKRTIYAATLLISSDLLVSAALPRPGPSFITGPVGLFLLASLSFVFIAYGVKRTVQPKNYLPTLAKVIFSFSLIGILIVAFGLSTGVSGRYLTAVYPFQRSADPLVESVAEHVIPTGSDYFSSYFVLLFLGGFGAYTLLRKRSLSSALALILGISGVYIASSFSRLMVYSSIAFAILAGIGFSTLSASLLKPGVVAVLKKKSRLYEVRSEVKIMYSVFMIGLLTMPLVYPVESNWLSNVDVPVSIANGGTGFRLSLPDWMEALTWMRENTPTDAVFAAWWDYGYWITVMGNRTSLADNATNNSTRISQLGRMYMSNETQALKILSDLKADYVVVYVVGQRVQSSGQNFYLLGGGGDESKMKWFIEIGGLNTTDYLYGDVYPKPYLWDNAFIGKLVPFRFFQYIDEQGQFVGTQYNQTGSYTPVYTYDMKITDSKDSHLKLAFISSSLAEQTSQGVFAGVLIYEILQ